VLTLLVASSDDVWSAAISTAPALIGVVVVVAFVLLNWTKFGGLVNRISKVKVAGIEMELAAQTLKTARAGYTVTDENADVLAKRINRVADLMAQTRILWVDDNPLGNRGERTYLRLVRATVVNVLSTAEALAALARDDFTLVITDMARNESGTLVPDAGERLATQMRAQKFDQPTPPTPPATPRHSPTRNASWGGRLIGERVYAPRRMSSRGRRARTWGISTSDAISRNGAGPRTI
jgi:PleD family two-component response regulator